jgi:hypothetical protein
MEYFPYLKVPIYSYYKLEILDYTFSACINRNFLMFNESKSIMK